MAQAEEPRERMIRVNLSDEDWAALKIKAVQRGEPVQVLVGELLRQAAERWR